MTVVFSYSILAFLRFNMEEENAAKTVVWTGSIFDQNASSETNRYVNALVWT